MQAHQDLVGTGNDVAAGQHQALAGNDDTGPERALQALAALIIAIQQAAIGWVFENRRNPLAYHLGGIDIDH